jgi:hypothetical protein
MDNRDPGRDPGLNVGCAERWISGGVGAALLWYGLRRTRLRALLLPLGLGLIRRAVTGRCEVNRALGRNSARDEGAGAEQSVVIDRPRAELFQFWRRFDNLPRFMDNLESVSLDRRSHCGEGPGAPGKWDARSTVRSSRPSPGAAAGSMWPDRVASRPSMGAAPKSASFCGTPRPPEGGALRWHTPWATI